ncbi:MAG TPA: DUF6484 domain-containing protein [Blastocatellia bacterium]|nr:DUF6484 domain-containing protein [Blastocatellia bacterium]
MLESLNESVTELSAETDRADLPSRKDRPRIHGIVTGTLTGFDEAGSPLVTAVEAAISIPIAARSVVALSDREFGRELVLMFDSGDPRRPIVMGVIEPATERRPDRDLSVKLDGERMLLTAEREIVLKCGEASITLTRAGKILIRGAYVSSRASGVNRIKGGSILLN